MIFLSSSAQRWPHLGTTGLFPLLRAEPGLIQVGGSAALIALANAPSADASLLAAIMGALPARPDPDLDPGIAVLAVRHTEQRLVADEAPSNQAALHAALAWRLSNAGRYEEPLTRWERTVEILRVLAGDDPAFRPRLAHAIAGQASALTDLGRHVAALEISEEAVALRRELVRADCGPHLQHLGESLNNHSNVLSDLHRHEEAMAAAREAVEIYEELATLSPAALTALAVTLSTAGNRYSDLGRHAEALAHHERSLSIRCDQLGKHAAGDHDTALSLANLAVALRPDGQRTWWSRGRTATAAGTGHLRRFPHALPAQEARHERRSVGASAGVRAAIHRARAEHRPPAAHRPPLRRRALPPIADRILTRLDQALSDSLARQLIRRRRS
ncbi:tetratricopeptide repeat protein [Micromonospora sp. NPDC051006]|uniref:tetratricopeptide repeat protein n=1 Tax=Micromonospora sp. NPDC051006 TaxID=3364283 RepID=UPI0037B2B636